MDKPKRRYMLTLKLGADDMERLRQTLSSISFDLEGVDEQPHWMISGAPDAGFTLDIQFDPNVTHESYHEHLKAYIAEREVEKENEKVTTDDN